MPKTATPSAPKGAKNQPVSNVQWLDPSQLQANDYNPNHVAPPELRLLKLSILENGWTQPIVVRPRPGAEGSYEIVDGFHRWTVGQIAELAKLTDGLVPVVFLNADLDPATQRMATIRHNRARGQHHVVRMADIVNDLFDQGLEADEIGRRLEMDREEVDRLHHRGNMLKRGHDGEGLGKAWVPGVADDTGFDDEETDPDLAEQA